MKNPHIFWIGFHQRNLKCFLDHFSRRSVFLLGIILIVLIFISCTSKEKGINVLVGEWNYSGIQTELTITKQDTTVIGILNQTLHDNMQSPSIEYPVGSVLFKDIKKLSDTTFIAKGLYIKPVYRTEEVFVRSYFTFQKDHYETTKVFDHNENIYVDYRLMLRVKLENIKSKFIRYDELNCIPFVEGPRWTFFGKLSPEDKIFLEQEIKIVNDSIRIADSTAVKKAEQIRQKAIDSQKSKRAQELLK
ncbi:MAG: hypothetical protein ABSD71_00260 [Bacteroidales bacterium]|jgi:hypothetical protein